MCISFILARNLNHWFVEAQSFKIRFQFNGRVINKPPGACSTFLRLIWLGWFRLITQIFGVVVDGFIKSHLSETVLSETVDKTHFLFVIKSPCCWLLIPDFLTLSNLLLLSAWLLVLFNGKFFICWSVLRSDDFFGLCINGFIWRHQEIIFDFADAEAVFNCLLLLLLIGLFLPRANRLRFNALWISALLKKWAYLHFDFLLLLLFALNFLILLVCLLEHHILLL